MTSLSQSRNELMGVLSTLGVPVIPHLPDRFTPPIAILVQGSPYVEAGPTFGTSTIRFTLVIIAGQGQNEIVTKELDALIERTLIEVTDSEQYFVETIHQPALYKHGQATFLSCPIDIRIDVRLGD